MKYQNMNMELDKADLGEIHGQNDIKIESNAFNSKK